MSKRKGVRMRSWLWSAVCVVIFLFGVVSGKLWFTRSTNGVTLPTSSKNLLKLNIPQKFLPPDWFSKENLPGNSFATALIINTGIQTQGTLSVSNAVDYYAFTLKNPSRIIIDVTTVPKALYWVLYNDQLKEVASTYRTGTSQGSTQVSLQDPGKYYIKVWADYSELTNYPYTIRLNILPYFE